MKTVHINKEGVRRELRIWLPEVRVLEKSNKLLAITEYKKMSAAYPMSEEIYDRLMILYRKLNEHDEELRWIAKAISVFEKSFARKNKPGGISKINSLSRSILKSTGLVDKKGKALYQPQPIGRWQKRKDLLKARMERL
jgi:hypothetical protein